MHTHTFFYACLCACVCFVRTCARALYVHVHIVVRVRVRTCIGLRPYLVILESRIVLNFFFNGRIYQTMHTCIHAHYTYINIHEYMRTSVYLLRPMPCDVNMHMHGASMWSCYTGRKSRHQVDECMGKVSLSGFYEDESTGMLTCLQPRIL
jgi:hypothetical protein